MTPQPAPSGPGGRLVGWVLSTPRWKFLTALFLVMFFKTGLTFVAPALALAAKNPYANPYSDPFQHYLFWSWLGPFLAHLLHAWSSTTFTLFYLAFSLGFMAMMVRWIFRSLDERTARVAMIIFALVPASATSFYWIFTDSLTLFLWALALQVRRNPVLLLLIGVGLGMQHFEQAFVGAAAATFVLAWSARRGAVFAYSWRWALTLAIGALLGKVVLVLVFAQLGIHINSGRWYWVVKAWPILVQRFLYSAHFAVFSMFAVGWLALWALLRQRGPEVLPAAVAILGLACLLPISDDPTRVFAITSFPLVCVLLLSNQRFLASIDDATLGLWVGLWLLVPWMFVWAGKPIVSAAAYDIWAVVQRVFETETVPRDPRFPL